MTSLKGKISQLDPELIARLKRRYKELIMLDAGLHDDEGRCRFNCRTVKQELKDLLVEIKGQSDAGVIQTIIERRIRDYDRERRQEATRG